MSRIPPRISRALLAVGIVVSGVGAMPGSAAAGPQADCDASQAHISFDEAGRIALNAVSANIVREIELDCENGRLVYEVEVYRQADNEDFDIDVDAVTSAVLKIDD